MDKIREELHKCISLYGIKDLRTIKKSEEVDKLIAEEMEERKC